MDLPVDDVRTLPPQMEDSIPTPLGRGADARRWLESQGFVPQQPFLRSSDDHYIGDEFLYYLCRILGLYPAFSISTALSRGSWLHKALEYWTPKDGVNEKPVRDALAVRLTELRAVGSELGVGGTSLAPYLEVEERDCLTAMAWFQAANKIAINREYGSLTTYFGQSHWKCLGHEIVIVRKDCGLTHVITLDSFWLHTGQNQLWIFDAKSCAERASDRAQTCPIEFQTRMYIHDTQWALDQKMLHKEYPELPPNVTLGGMIHWTMQKPTITFGQKDRRYWYVSEGKRTGNKGAANKIPGTEGWQAVGLEGLLLDRANEDAAVEALREYTGKKPTKVYAGEPSVDLYVARCKNWYLGEGDYERDEAERQAHVPVDMSITPARYVFDAAEAAEYDKQLVAIGALSLTKPQPDQFIRRTSGLRSYGKLSRYAPFYLSPVTKWPEIALRERFIVAPRDKDIPTESCVNP